MVIGERLFVDGVTRQVYLDANRQQFVIGYDGEHVYGVWLLTPEVLDDTPAVVVAGGVCSRCGR
jgi:hypothetical protein